MQADSEFKGREFELTDSDFKAISKAIYESSGIALNDTKVTRICKVI